VAPNCSQLDAIIVLEKLGRLCIKQFSPKAIFYGCRTQSILIELNYVSWLLKDQAVSSHEDAEAETIFAA
jgi:hypothetical protein